MEQLVNLRKQKGLTQSDLAKLVGKSQSTVAYWENGSSKPRVKTLFCLAAALGVSVEEIIKCFQ